MSLLQINTAIPLAEPLVLEQEQEQEQERRITDHHCHAEHYHGAKFIALGAVTGFFIQIVSLGSYAFLLLHYQPARHTQVGYDDEEEDAMTGATTTTAAAASMNGFLPHEQPQSMTYAFLSILTQVDLVVYVLIWVAFTCTMTRNGMTCIRAQFFSNNSGNEEGDDEDEESRPAVSVTKGSNIKRRYVFLLGVYFLVGIVSGAFLAWSAIDIYLGFPIPFKPILLTVTVDLILCYCMVRCYDMGKKKKNQNQLSPPRNEEDEDDEEIDFSLPSHKGTEEVLLRRLYDIDPTLMEHVAGSDGVLMEHIDAGSEGEFVYVHESPPPCPGFTSSPTKNQTVVLHASPPCQGFSSSKKMNNTVHVPVHVSPPCQRFSSSSK